MEKKLLEMSFLHNFDHEPTYCDLWVLRKFSMNCQKKKKKFSMSYGDDTFEIWVIKEYKVHLSWTKICVLSIGISTKYFHPICSSKNGDIIGTKDGTRLVKYNDKGQFLEYHSYGKDLHGSQVALYVESLFSLPGDIKQV